MRVGHEVSVAVHGRRDGSVTELGLHVLQVLALVDEHRGVRVAQVVEADSA